MSWRRRAWLALAALLAGCASVPPPDAFITGTVIARERLYIPPDAVFDAALVDVTQVGEPPLVLARQRIAPAGPLPYELRIPYRQALIQPRGRYEVHAAVTQQGRLLLDTPGVHPVLLSPAFRHVDVILARRPLQEATLNAPTTRISATDSLPTAAMRKPFRVTPNTYGLKPGPASRAPVTAFST